MQTMHAKQCAPLVTERVISPENCSAMRAVHTRRTMLEQFSGAQAALRFPLASILRFVHHGTRLLQFGSGELSWTGPFVATLSLLQGRAGLHGSVGEIGVHHGMFAIVVAHQARLGERMLAADLFDTLQSLNVDHSGNGDLRRFLRNMRRFGIQRDDIDVRIGLSSTLPLRYPHPLRLFSVDGGHTEAIASGDIAWAACNAIDGAIIMVDDWPSPGWPGVKQGAKRHWECGARKLTPFADVQNKLYLTTSRAAAKHYRSELMKLPFWAARFATDGVVHGSRVLRVRDRDQTTTAVLTQQWEQAVMQQANLSSDSSQHSVVAPAWSTWLQMESKLAKWRPQARPLKWLQDELLDKAFLPEA